MTKIEMLKLKKDGKSYAEIARLGGVSRQWVQAAIGKYVQNIEHIKECKICGALFIATGNRSLYCDRCKKIAMNISQAKFYQRKKTELFGEKKKKKPIIKKKIKCAYCGKEFEKGIQKTYCCTECRDMAYGFKKEPATETQERTLEKMSGDDLFNYGKISAMKQIEQMRLQRG